MSYADDQEMKASMLGYAREPTDDELAEYLRRSPTRAGQQHFYPPAPQSAAAKAALEPILRSRQPARFRLLQVVCQKDHALATVYRTAAGPVVTGRGPISDVQTEVIMGDTDDPYGNPVFWSYEWSRTYRGNRQEKVCFFLGQLGPHAHKRTGFAAMEKGEVYETYGVATFQCRCRTARITGDWLADHIGANRRRVVFA